MNMKLIITSLMIHQNESSKKIMKIIFYFGKQRTKNRKQNKERISKINEIVIQ